MATRLKEADLVIIGLGAAGGVAVLPIAQAGIDVVALEAGTWLSKNDFAPDELRNNVRDWPMAVQKAQHEIPTQRLFGRVLGTDEVLALLSHLRLGVNLGRINTVDIRTINELFLLTQPAHLQRLTGVEMEQTARREARARFIRQRLGTR